MTRPTGGGAGGGITAAGCLRAAFWIAFVFYLCWCGLYVFRTSFVLDGKRVFCLWDDAMVSMRYARNLAAGHGLVWNAGGERVQGYSNLGVTLLMAAIHMLPIDRTRTSLVFQILNAALLGYVVLLVRAIVRRLFESEVAADAAGLAMMACASFSVLGLQGTDVVVVTTLLLMAFRAVADSTASGGTWPDWVYLVLAAGVVMRLDFVLVFCVFAGASMFFPRARTSPLVAVAVLAVTLLSVLGWQFAFYGSLLPNTYYLKLTGMPLRLLLLRGIEHTAANLLLHNLVPICAAACALYAFQRRDRRLWLLGLLVVALVAYNVRTGGDWLDSTLTSRFLAPALPLLVIGLVGGFWCVLRRLGFRAAGGNGAADGAFWFSGSVILIVFAILIGASLSTAPSLIEWSYPGSETQWRSVNIADTELAFYLQEHSSPDLTLAVDSAGATAYFLDRYTIDLLGKTDSHLAHSSVPYFQPGSKTDWNYILSDRRPDLIEYPDLAEYPPDLARMVVDQYVRVETPADVPLILRKDALGKMTGADLRISPIVFGPS